MRRKAGVNEVVMFDADGGSRPGLAQRGILEGYFENDLSLRFLGVLRATSKMFVSSRPYKNIDLKKEKTRPGGCTEGLQTNFFAVAADGTARDFVGAGGGAGPRGRSRFAPWRLNSLVRTARVGLPPLSLLFVLLSLLLLWLLLLLLVIVAITVRV